MRGERRIYTQGIKVGHFHVSQRLLSMIVGLIQKFLRCSLLPSFGLFVAICGIENKEQNRQKKVVSVIKSNRFLSIFQIFIVVLLGEGNQETSSGQVFRRCSGGRCE